MPYTSKYPPELRERAVRTALNGDRPVSQVARDLSINVKTLHNWLRRARADTGIRTDIAASDELTELRELRREIKELRKANEILKSASVFFAKELDQDRPK